MGKVSVIVPVYNMEQYLQRCVESLINLELDDYEIILVDDGSVDASGEICKRYEETYSNVKMISKKNGGENSARNAGLKISEGKYVAFVDADDWIDSKFLTDFVKKMDEDDSLDICIGGMVRNYSDNREDKLFYCTKDFYASSSETLKNMMEQKLFRWNLCGKLFRKELIKRLPDYNIYRYADLEGTWQLVCRANMIWYSAKYQYHYFMNPDSATEKQDDLLKKEAITVFQRILESNTMPDLYVKKLFLKVYLTEILVYIREIFINEKQTVCKDKLVEYQNCFREWYSLVRDLGFVTKETAEAISGTYQNCCTYYLSRFQDMMQNLEKEIQPHYSKGLYIYGAGRVAGYAARLLKRYGIEFEGFVITDGKASKQNFMNKKVLFISEISNPDHIVFFVALDFLGQEKVIPFLQEKGFRNLVRFDASLFSLC